MPGVIVTPTKYLGQRIATASECLIMDSTNDFVAINDQLKVRSPTK